MGDSGKRREERVKVRAEKLKVKETEREIKQAERAERVKKRKEVFNILMDKDGFDAGEKGGFAGGNDSITVSYTHLVYGIIKIFKRIYGRIGIIRAFRIMYCNGVSLVSMKIFRYNGGRR